MGDVADCREVTAVGVRDGGDKPMKFSDFGLAWRGPHCPHLVIQVSPGLFPGSLEEVFNNTESECGITPGIVLDPNRRQTHMVLVRPYLFASDIN